MGLAAIRGNCSHFERVIRKVEDIQYKIMRQNKRQRTRAVKLEAIAVEANLVIG